MSADLRIEDVVRGLEDAYPTAWADPWDRVGLVCGDPDAPARRILVTLDLDALAVARAVEDGFDVVVTHHPPFLEALGDCVRGRGMGRGVFDCLGGGVAVAVFHTNLDRAPEGREVLPKLLGLEVEDAVESGVREVDLVVAYAPEASSAELERVMAGAGAGRVGEYDGCSFEAAGTGRYRPREGASPSVGTAGVPAAEEEVRLEMVCDPRATARVLAAAREAHPYEEPVLWAVRGSLSRGAARLGALCRVPEGGDLGGVATRAADRLECTPRVWGGPETPVSLVAVATGSASSLVGRVIETGAHALVCGEVRYHVAQEALDNGLAVVELGHDVSEWPLVGVLAERLRSITGLGAGDLVQEQRRVRWWTGRGSDDGPG